MEPRGGGEIEPQASRQTIAAAESDIEMETQPGRWLSTLAPQEEGERPDRPRIDKDQLNATAQGTRPGMQAMHQGYQVVAKAEPQSDIQRMDYHLELVAWWTGQSKCSKCSGFHYERPETCQIFWQVLL